MVEFSSSVSPARFKYFFERLDHEIVLFRRAHAQTEIIAQHRIPAYITNQNISFEQFCENLLRVHRRAHNHEVRLRTHGRKSFDQGQLAIQSSTLGDDL